MKSHSICRGYAIRLGLNPPFPVQSLRLALQRGPQSLTHARTWGGLAQHRSHNRLIAPPFAAGGVSVGACRYRALGRQDIC